MLSLYAVIIVAPEAEFDWTTSKSERSSIPRKELQFEKQQRQEINKEQSAMRSKKTTPQASIRSLDDYTAHEAIPLYDGRSKFLQALKTRDLDGAKNLWNQVRNSNLTTEDFAKHIVDAYNSKPDMVNIYSGKSFDEAHDLLMKDLVEINPHLAKTFRDQFKTQPKSSPALQPRNDQAYFDWLDENPTEITQPYALHEKTPFEVAVATASPEMADGIIKVARSHGYSSLDLVDPLINEYKKTLRTQGEDAALKLVDKVTALGNKRISRVFLDHVIEINAAMQK
jgi:hypothetical protein